VFWLRTQLLSPPINRHLLEALCATVLRCSKIRLSVSAYSSKLHITTDYERASEVFELAISEVLRLVEERRGAAISNPIVAQMVDR
jgi:hypothetical protein